MPNSNINYAMWLGSQADRDYEAVCKDIFAPSAEDYAYDKTTNEWYLRGLSAASDEDAPSNRARETIKDLKAGTVPQSIVRDLGDAVKQATRDGGVGRAIGQDRMVGGLSR